MSIIPKGVNDMNPLINIYNLGIKTGASRRNLFGGFVADNVFLRPANMAD